MFFGSKQIFFVKKFFGAQFSKKSKIGKKKFFGGKKIFFVKKVFWGQFSKNKKK